VAVAFKKACERGEKWVHYCPEWDYMTLWKGCPEFSVCICDFDPAFWSEDGTYFPDGRATPPDLRPVFTRELLQNGCCTRHQFALVASGPLRRPYAQKVTN